MQKLHVGSLRRRLLLHRAWRRGARAILDRGRSFTWRMRSGDLPFADGVVLEDRVDLASQDEDEPADVEPGEEYDHAADGTVGGVVLPEMLRVLREAPGRDEPQERPANRARGDVAPLLLRVREDVVEDGEHEHDDQRGDGPAQPAPYDRVVALDVQPVRHQLSGAGAESESGDAEGDEKGGYDGDEDGEPLRLPERSRLLDVVGEIERGAQGVDAARGAPERDGEAEGEKLRALHGDDRLEVLLHDRRGGIRHDRGQARHQLVGSAFDGEIRRERDEEEEEGEEREQEVIRKLGSLVGDRVVAPMLVELP